MTTSEIVIKEIAVLKRDIWEFDQKIDVRGPIEDYKKELAVLQAREVDLDRKVEEIQR